MLAYIGGPRHASTQSLEDDSSEDNESIHSSSEDDTKYDVDSRDEEIEFLSTKLSTTLELLAESQAKCKQLERELDQLSKNDCYLMMVMFSLPGNTRKANSWVEVALPSVICSKRSRVELCSRPRSPARTNYWRNTARKSYSKRSRSIEV